MNTITTRFYPDGMTIIVMDDFGWEKLLLTKDEKNQLYQQLTKHFEAKDTKTGRSRMEAKVGAGKKKSKGSVLHLRRKSVGRTTRGK